MRLELYNKFCLIEIIRNLNENFHCNCPYLSNLALFWHLLAKRNKKNSTKNSIFYQIACKH